MLGWLIPDWLQSAWHFVASPSSIPVAVGIAATAVAVLLPKQLDFITDLRKWAIVVAVGAFSMTGLLAHGYSNGLAEKQRQWDNALAAETIAGDTARSDAVDAVGPVPADRRMFDNDPWNRDPRPVGSQHKGALRWLEGHRVFGKR